MPNLTLYLPKDLHRKMKQVAWVNWSAVARESIKNKLEWLERAGLVEVKP